MISDARATHSHTAATLAARLGITKRAVLQALCHVPAASMQANGTAPAQAWSLPQLPEHWRDELRQKAERDGFADVDTWISIPRAPWPPRGFPPLSEISPQCLDKAATLQRALAPSLARRDSPLLSGDEFEKRGVEDYAKEFDHPITQRHFRALFKRTVDRDAGAENFNRLILYLDERPARKTPLPSAPARGSQTDFPELRAVLETFKDQTAPTAREKEYLWLRAFEICEERAGKPGKTLRAIVRFLYAIAPWLARNEAALRKMFRRKLARWLAGDKRVESLTDRRKDNSGFHRAPEVSAEDRDAIIARAVLNCDGRVSQAWRELSQRGALSESLSGYYLGNPSSKSYCPSRIREAVKHEIEMMADIHHGPRQDKLNGAHLLRNWSGVAAMDWICADDATLEIYFYDQDAAGGFTLMRGQFLVFIDSRSLCVLGFALQPERNYNARVIKTAITRVCDEHGLPRQGFYFEGGIWQKSRILKGDPCADPVSWPEAELGLRSLGLRFVHSRLPRSKPVERVIGALQDLMEGEPGYVGPDEMHERFERVQRAKLLVERGAIHPSEHFYSLDQWVARLGEICAQYNATKQDGKMTGGLSPDEAFEKCSLRDDPPIKLPPSCRYLLAHHKRPLRVTSNGITLRFGKQVYNYRNEQTGRLRGQTVLAWFNPELPDILTVTDMNRENPFCIERTQEVPAMDAPPELLAQENARIEAHMSYARVRYRTLKARFSVPFRRAIPEKGTAALGVEMAAQQEQIEARRVEEQKRLARVSKRASAVGYRPTLVENSERSHSALDLMTEARREHEREAGQSTAQPSKKTYVLKPFGSGQREYVEYLLGRLAQFRQAGGSFGQSFHGHVSTHSCRKIAARALNCDVFDPARFDEVCAYLKTKIDATILGKKNAAAGHPNYHEFQPQEAS